MWSHRVCKLAIPRSAVRRSHESNVVELGIQTCNPWIYSQTFHESNVVVQGMQTCNPSICSQTISREKCGRAGYSHLQSLDQQSEDLTGVMWSSRICKLVIPGSARKRFHESNVVELGMQTCNPWICSQMISRE